MAEVIAVFGHRFQILQGVQADFGHRFSILQGVQAEFGHKFRVFDKATAIELPLYNITEPGDPEDPDDTRHPIMGQLTLGKRTGAMVSIRKDGEERSLPVDSLTITRAKSEPLKWTASIFDPDGEYSPEAGSDWFEWLTPELQPAGDPSKLLSITIFQGQAERTYTDLILLSRSYEADPESGYSMTLSGSDYSQVLFRDNQTLPTYEFSRAFYIIRDILEEYGINEIEINLDQDLDFPVMQMDFQQDRPINRIQTLLNEIGAFWRMEGRRFIVWEPAILDRSEWNYRDNQSVYMLSLSEQVLTQYNKVTACRVTKNADIAYSQSGSGAGRMTGTFSGTYYLPTLYTDLWGSRIDNVDWFYKGQYQGQGYSLVGFADEFYFTVLGTGGTNILWEVEVRGTPEEYLGTGINLDAQYTYTDDGSIALYGELPAPNLESNFTASDLMAQRKAEAFMREQGRMKRDIQFTAPVNPYLELDETIYLDETVSRFNGYFNVDSITTSISTDRSEDRIEVVEYVK